jgi:hypothetical protein
MEHRAAAQALWRRVAQCADHVGGLALRRVLAQRTEIDDARNAEIALQAGHAKRHAWRAVVSRLHRCVAFTHRPGMSDAFLKRLDFGSQFGELQLKIFDIFAHDSSPRILANANGF